MLRRILLVLACAASLYSAGLCVRVHAQDEIPPAVIPEPVAAPPAAVGNYVAPPIPIGVQNAMGTMAFNRQWVHTYGTQDWERFYHYPYVFYPQNFWGNEYYRSAEHLYYRYPPEMRIPVYNKQWHNYYPEGANWNRYLTHQYIGPPTGGRYHLGHHFILDTF
jgi:hypothetical protein